MPADYTVLSQVHENKWQPQLQTAVAGWTVTVRDNITGTIVPVFIDDAHFSAENVQTYVEAALKPIRAVAQLGSTPPAPSGG